jgi:hypothetical protein
MAKILWMLALASPLLFCFATSPELTCLPPANVTVVSKSGCNIAFDWSDCAGGCSQYLLKYQRKEDGYQSQVFGVGESAYSFAGLPSGTYVFSFATDCGGETSGFILIEEVIFN